MMFGMSDKEAGPVRSATVITPCLNAEHLIAATAESIMDQTAVRSDRLALQYIVCDGASTDRTRDVVREICGDRAEILSAKDRGMYEALASGLRRATGDVVSYLNAGDVYNATALDVVADVFEDHPAVEWIMGMYVVRNEKGQIIQAHLPFRCRRRLLRKALLFKIVRFGVQQESTFWRRGLLSLVDLGELAAFRLAGDAYLWRCFSARTEPTIVESCLGGWTQHEGQLSSDMDSYLKELGAHRGRVTPLDLVAAFYDSVEGRLPPRVRKWLNANRLLRYSRQQERWV